MPHAPGHGQALQPGDQREPVDLVRTRSAAGFGLEADQQGVLQELLRQPLLRDAP